MVLDTLPSSACFEKVVTVHDIMAFSMLTGDYNYIHLDSNVVHGMLIASYVSRLIGMKLPGNGAVIADMSLRFKSPAYANDTLIISGHISQKSTAAKCVVVAFSVKNQKDDLLVSGESTVKVP